MVTMTIGKNNFPRFGLYLYLKTWIRILTAAGISTINIAVVEAVDKDLNIIITLNKSGIMGVMSSWETKIYEAIATKIPSPTRVSPLSQVAKAINPQSSGKNPL